MFKLVRDKLNERLKLHQSYDGVSKLSARFDLVELICESEELLPFLNQLIQDGKLSPKALQQLYNDYVMLPWMRDPIQEGKPVPRRCIAPNFYTVDIEKRFGLHRKYCDLVKDENFASKDVIRVDPNKPSISTLPDAHYRVQRAATLLKEMVTETINRTPATDTARDSISTDARSDTHLLATQEKPLLFEGYDDSTYSIMLSGRSIPLSRARRETDPVLFMRTLSKQPHKTWFDDEILEDWEMQPIDCKKNKVYQTARRLNDVVGQAIGTRDFILYSTRKFTINPKYLSGDH